MRLPHRAYSSISQDNLKIYIIRHSYWKSLFCMFSRTFSLTAQNTFKKILVQNANRTYSTRTRSEEQKPPTNQWKKHPPNNPTHHHHHQNPWKNKQTNKKPTKWKISFSQKHDADSKRLRERKSTLDWPGGQLGCLRSGCQSVRCHTKVYVFKHLQKLMKFKHQVSGRAPEKEDITVVQAVMTWDVPSSPNRYECPGWQKPTALIQMQSLFHAVPHLF